MPYFTQPVRYFVLFCLCMIFSTAGICQIPPSPVLSNCPDPGLGFKNFPVTVNISGQTVSVGKTTNTYAFSMSPNSKYNCGIAIKPGTMLLFPYVGQSGGSVTFTFSKPVSNVQLAMATQVGQGGAQLTITAVNGTTPVTPVLSVFNSSADSCPGRYSVSGNVVHANPDMVSFADMINVGNCYFTSLTIQNTSVNSSRNWIDLRLCNTVLDNKSPKTQVVNPVGAPH